MTHPRLPALAAELLGTALLLAAVVGSGIMADRLSGGNDGIALLANSIATGAALVVLIEVFGPLSGAQFNPAVTLALAGTGRQPWGHVAPLIAAQLIGGLMGVGLAHAMFDLPMLQISGKIRTGPGQWLSEAIATFALLTVIFAALRQKAEARLPYSVALIVTAAYWFTASTSFANPAVTLARAFSDSFAGIALTDTPGFILAQGVGALLAIGFDVWLRRSRPVPLPE